MEFKTQWKNYIFGLFTALALSGCIRMEKVVRDCQPTGNERYALYINGTLMGGFEKLEVSTDYKSVLFTKGFFPPGPFLTDWRDFNATAPLVAEKHDITLFKASRGRIDSVPLAELVGAKYEDIEGALANDNPQCLIIDSLKLSVDRVTVFRGTITPFL